MQFRKRGDCAEMMRLMQRRQRNKARQLVDYLGIDANRPVVERAAVDDAMPGRDQCLFGKARLEPAKKRCNDVLVRPGLREIIR